ncbi:MAG: UbiA-like polyprenyltransferase [Thermodesulfovibrio sp.]|uniref:4-hydroxybenzoate polyprenyltransferase n=2 Tax=Thermodesulfovibrio TaxID=28261 RepID=A0A2J6WQL9_9BACT|nr:MAG: 4-hydroxybenzoate octaprenyltransferase [Thermodesulfovibrio aggregans]
MSILNKAVLYLRMIKIEHSVFALPFAFAGALLSAGGIPQVEKILWITVAMVTARASAFGFNRIIDRKIDALNPRTAQREIPTGKIKLWEAALFTVLCLIIFVYSAWMLNPLCFKLSPLAIFILFIYSYTKRFTWACHFVLGLALALAPLGAWIAVRGSFNWEIIPMVLTVVFWLAGFDTLYAMWDVDFDKKYGIYSIPKVFGVKKAIYLARLFHFIAWSFLVLTGFIFKLNMFYWLGMAVVAYLFINEHRLVKPHDLSKLNIAFFNMNGYISVTVFIFTAMAVLIKL